MNPIYAPFHQIAYVTTDMTRALELMREDMGIPSFLLRDHDVEAIVGGRRGRMRMQLALANLDGVQIELIADHGSDFDVYTECLPKDGNFGLVFHHFCNLIPGGIEEWEAHLAALEAKHPLYYQPLLGTQVQAVYTDERHRLGHYLEHIWFSPEAWARFDAMIPRHRRSPLAAPVQ